VRTYVGHDHKVGPPLVHKIEPIHRQTHWSATRRSA
jgi:hypothetical protein